jgi:anti-anti-sigma factor
MPPARGSGPSDRADFDAPDSGASDFAIAIALGTTETVVAVTGELAEVTAPELAAVLEAVTGRPYRRVILDLGRVTLLGGAGLQVLVDHVASASPGTVVLRGPSRQAVRVLQIAGLTGPRDLVMPVIDEHETRLGPEEIVTDADATTRGSQSELVAAALRRGGSVPADSDVVDGAMQLVASLAQATVPGADGASVTLRRHGGFSSVAATDRVVLNMDGAQYVAGEGPCLAAATEGRWFHVEQLANETRWPEFIPKARLLGIRAILSLPLTGASGPFGALNLYSRSVAAFGEDEQQLASRLALEASNILIGANADLSGSPLSEWLDEALATRSLIAQAQGIVMEREGLSAEAAYVVLRHASQRSDRPLRIEAEDEVASTRRLPGLRVVTAAQEQNG